MDHSKNYTPKERAVFDAVTERRARRFLDPDRGGELGRRTPLNLSTPKDVALEWGLSEVAQWRARRAGDLSFYRIGGRLYYSDEHLISYAKRRENIALREEKNNG